MHRFYQPDLETGTLELDAEESRHALRVLRLKVGDNINVTDGLGAEVLAEITELGKKHCGFKVLNKSFQARPVLPSVAIAPTKSLDRFEWFLEKATEIGVADIYPILCSNSERRVLKTDRSKKILVAAMKQSKRTWLPQLHELCSLDEFLFQASENLFLAHCEVGQKQQLSAMATARCCIMIGPEGDFSLQEIEAARNKGALEIDLGNVRLRTETAAIFALSAMNFLNR